MSQFVEQGHLGGYIAGGDEATYYPDLWDWFIGMGWRTILDIGCGEGHSTRYFRERDALVVPIDGIAQPQLADFILHDFTEGPWRYSLGEHRFGLAWCCEVVEHIEEQYLPNLLETFAYCKVVAMTHAEPGQQGYHHVNCQPYTYWRGALAAFGFRLDEGLTAAARALAARNTNPYNHFVRSGLIFCSSLPAS